MRITFERPDEGAVDKIADFDEFKQLFSQDIPALSSWSDAQIAAAFGRFDRDGSGNIDTFELAAALGTLLGRPATTREVWAIVSHGELKGEKSIDLELFSALLRTFGWNDQGLLEDLPYNVFEHTFTEEKLGIAFHVDVESGFVVVAKVLNEALTGLVEVKDRILAVNGAPIGIDEDPRVRCVRKNIVPCTLF